MFKTQNFCHIASNNRNQVKVGVFVYRTTDSLETVSASGYFNERIIDLKLHDIIIHEQIDASDATKVKQNFLSVVERTLTNVKVKIMDTDEVDGANTDLSNLTTTGKANISALGTYDSSATYTAGSIGAAIKENATGLAAKLNLDGSNTMTGVLKMRASVSFKGAIAPYWDGIGFYKLNDNDSVTLMASIEDTTGFIPAGTSVYDIGSSDHKWKDLYVARVITGVLNNGADIAVPTTGGTMARLEDIGDLAERDLSNLKSKGQNISNWSTNVTNCITEIPQDIVITNPSNVLTVNAGSKAYLGDGTAINIGVDITYPAQTWENEYLVAVNATGTGVLVAVLSGCVSAASNPGTANIIWFNTTDNKCYKNDSAGAATECSMPVGVVTSTSSGWTQIDHVFNGFGYIGSTVFALPGVKGLIPNGRNSDGSLNNIEYTLTSIATLDMSPVVSGSRTIILKNNGTLVRCSVVNITPENYLLRDGLTQEQAFSILDCQTDSSKIIVFERKRVFQAFDASDINIMANMAMPSNIILSLTLGSSGATYTAPADGYFYVSKLTDGSNQYLQLVNQTAGNMQYFAWGPTNGAQIRLIIPAGKGDSIQVAYTAGGTTQAFNFVYANGSVKRS